MATTPVPEFYRHYAYDESTKTIWYMDEKPSDELGWVYLGATNNPIPASAATVFSMKHPGMEGCKVRRVV